MKKLIFSFNNFFGSGHFLIHEIGEKGQKIVWTKKVFPKAQLKVYFTADLDVRAERRYEQLLKSGSKPSLKNIRKSLVDRDEKDINREISPLKAAKDAVIIDSSKLNIESILDKILELYKISGV